MVILKGSAAGTYNTNLESMMYNILLRKSLGKRPLVQPNERWKETTK
jgi:hypothetical protein